VTAGGLGLALFLATMAVAATARADSEPPLFPRPPDHPVSDDGLRLTFGLGAAATGVPARNRVAVPLEATLVPRAFFNTSAGVVVSSLGIDEIYGELGVWLLADLGFGIGYGQRQLPHGVEWAPIGHVFVGAPIPLGDDFNVEKRWFAYALPYYRPSWDLHTNGGLSHEFGLMLKMSYAIRPTRVGGVFF
jgi:hypothetical protein